MRVQYDEKVAAFSQCSTAVSDHRIAASVIRCSRRLVIGDVPNRVVLVSEQDIANFRRVRARVVGRRNRPLRESAPASGKRVETQRLSLSHITFVLFTNRFDVV